MLYVRGNKHDYDLWESLGNPGWGWKDVLFYFKKSEDNRNPYLARSPYHSMGGYLTVQESPWHTPLVAAFIEAGGELGYENRDINGDKQQGFMIAQGTIRRGSRCSTAKAFLRPVRLRKNLHVAMNAHVTKVLIDKEKMQATGVEFVRYGKRYRISARREVIMSAGAINSAQLLMLSGIGPRKHLEQMGIDVLRDLQVGENLQDHVGMGGMTFLVDKPIAIIQDRFNPATTTNQYVLNERGPMTSLGGVEGLGFVTTKLGNHSIDWPDIQFHMAPASINSDAGARIKKVLGIKESLYQSVYAPIANKDAWTIMPLLLRPRSRGWVRLHSKNPFDFPLMDPNYFGDRFDIETLVQGAKIALKVAEETKVFKQFGSRIHRIPLPNCKQFKFLSDEYIECHIRTISMTIYHPVGKTLFSNLCMYFAVQYVNDLNNLAILLGTCKMGPEWDREAVVDPRLRVHGVKGLRVIDASISKFSH